MATGTSVPCKQGVSKAFSTEIFQFRSDEMQRPAGPTRQRSPRQGSNDHTGSSFVSLAAEELSVRK